MKHFGYDCPECVLLNLKIPTYLVYDNQKVNLKDVREIGKYYGGKLLSKSYIKTASPLEWQCKKSHSFKRSIASIRLHNKFCIICVRNEVNEKLKTYSLVDLKNYAKSKNGKLLSKKYITDRTLYKWQCNRGHIWETQWRNLYKNDRWCPRCSGSSKTINDLVKLGDSLQFKLISKTYIKANSFYDWKCSKNHKFKRTVKMLKSHGCPICLKKDNERIRIDANRKRYKDKLVKIFLSINYTNYKIEENKVYCFDCNYQFSDPILKSNSYKILFDKFNTICKNCITNEGVPEYYFSRTKITKQVAIQVAKFNNGKLLSNKVSRADNKLKWECDNGHIFTRTLISIKTHMSFCNQCSGYLGEEITRQIFEISTGVTFKKEKGLEWLKNKKGNFLELDGFSRKLNIAFEHQGSQHYGKSKFFESQSENDALKHEIIRNKGVKLLEVPSVTEYSTVQNTIDLVHKFLIKNGITPKKCAPMDIYPIKANEYLKDLSEIASKKGGKLLSKQYLGAHEKLLWSCKKGHTFELNPSNAKRHWCRKCSTPSYDINDLNTHAIKMGGKCLSKSYTTSYKKYRWECKNGHRWSSTWGSINNMGTWCATCAKVGSWKYTIDDLKEYAIKRGGKCISKEYTSTHMKYDWECKNNHSWSTSWHNLRKGRWCSKCLKSK